MSTRYKVMVCGIIAALAIGASAVGLNLFRQSTMAANDSAHAALTKEIFQRLVDAPNGHYPDSLSQLRLSYPDGGTTGLLGRFTYRSTGTSCTVHTVLRGEEIVRSFP